MDAGTYERLQREHVKEISSIRERIKQWEKFEADYTAVQERLKTLPKKLSHDVMVPFGSIAYMPGKLYHTNEVVVLLGDNWFMKCTADHAWEVAQRRKKYIVDKLKTEKQQLEEVQARSSFASEIQETNKDFMDIREEFDPEKEEKWREVHRKRRRDENRRYREEGTAKVDGSEVQTDAEVWTRLEELEREEEERYLKGQTIVEEEETDDWCKAAGDKQMDSDSLSLSSKQTIVFTHTDTDKEEHGNEGLDVTETEAERKPVFSTPADIYLDYQKTRTITGEGDHTSSLEISKKPDQKTVKWAPDLWTKKTDHTPRLPPPIKTTSVPFSGLVVERGSNIMDQQEKAMQTTKRMSKFKAEKSKKRTASS